MMQDALDLILLIDDDMVTNLMHRRQISRRGLARNVEEVADGRAALDYFEECARGNKPLPQLVLLDINMPGMNGFEFLEAYGDLPDTVRKGVHLVMVSTSDLPSDRARAEENPLVECYETKPLSYDDLERLVMRSRSAGGA
jgi:CheY-like chemotaxis protein